MFESDQSFVHFVFYLEGVQVQVQVQENSQCLLLNEVRVTIGSVLSVGLSSKAFTIDSTTPQALLDAMESCLDVPREVHRRFHLDVRPDS